MNASSDGDFTGLADQTVTTTITDDDAAGYTLSKTTSSITEGDNDTFTIVLDAEPSSNVVIDLSSDDTGAATVSPTSLTFTSGNWNSTQTVTITAEQDDDLQDESPTITASVNASSDGDFTGLADQTVTTTITDDDAAGYTLSKTTSSIIEGGNDTFTIVLDAEPSSNVVIDLSSDDTGAATVSPTSLTFTSGNWNSTQTVTITAEQDDDLQDESPTITASVNASSDGDFTGLADQTVTTTITDDDAAGYTLSKTTSSIIEGGNDTFTIVLDAEPSSNVVIDLSSDDTGAATVSPTSLTFTSGNWNSTQTVTITAEQDDDLQDESPTITASVNASSDGDFTGLADQTVTTTITDDDAAGYTLSKTTSSITEGGNDTFTIVLDAEPSSNVVIDLSSDDTGAATVSPTSLTFTSGNWNSTQTVTITAEQDDDLQDESPTITATINDASSDDAFDPLGDQTVAVTITDDETADFSVSTISGNTSEGGASASFTIVLDAQPASDVDFSITSDDVQEGVVNNPSITFTSANWDTPQTVNITGVDDDIDDGDQSYNIIISVDDASSDDAFDLLADKMVAVINEDDDITGISVSTVSGNTSEDGTAATFTIVLDSEPTGDVTIGLSSNDTSEGTVNPSNLTFTSANWNIVQTVTVTGVDDSDDDGDVTYKIVIAPAASSDANYNGADPSDITVINEDDENTPPVIVSQNGTLTSDEDEAFSIALSNLNVTDPDHSYPTDHTLIIGSGTNYQVSGNDIIPAENFNGNMTINVTVSDGIDESDNFELTVSILPVNDTPILMADQATVQFGNTVQGNLLDNDSDIENDELTLTDINPPIDGLTFEPDGSYVYDGNHAVGVFALDYVVCDNGDPSECAQSTLTITVEDGDQDLDGIPDSYEFQFDDVDQDGTAEYLDVDSDNDNIPDADEAGADPNNPVDTDGDGMPDFVDVDSDNDGKLDIDEGIDDCDGDGILNYVDSEDTCNMKIADAFSPNGDGKNDEWVIEGIENYPDNKVSIFNRWGVKVFEIDGYDNNSKVWRGQINANLGTTDAPFSTYYFIIDLKDGSKPIAGNILISR
ncbi:gliding motility-associated C-terminal domain-containing protein [Ekhidna sp.]|uniref:T9SS type B sorting domain-containing protein n=1 Tax=Ekhidna sp. TaxID=2608089 RepID=UPI003CCC2367